MCTNFTILCTRFYSFCIVPSARFFFFHCRYAQLLLKQFLKLLLADFFLLQQKIRAGIQHVAVLRNHLLRFFITFVNDPLHFQVNGGRNALSIASRVRQVSADKYLIIVIVVADQTNVLTFRIL